MKAILKYLMMLHAAVLVTPVAASICAVEFRLFEHAGGQTCIPVEPKRVVTLQDQNGLLPLMELGVRPVGSAGHLNIQGEKIFRRMEGYDTSGIEWIGSYRTLPDPEIVALLKPDLIIGAPGQLDAVKIYGQIAPTIVIDMFENTLDVALYQFADAVNRKERAVELESRFRERAATLRAQLDAALADTTLSIIVFAPQDGLIYPVEETQAMGLILNELQPVRPKAERDVNVARAHRSLETLEEHTADVMLQLVFDADDGGGSDTHAAFLEEPLLQGLPVARAGQVFPLDGSLMIGSAWGKAETGLEMIADILLREDLNRDLVSE